MINEMTVEELAKQLKNGDIELIDVRRADERDYCNIGGKHIPMNEIPERFSEIPRDRTVVVHCHHGGRSRKVIDWLQQTQGFTNLINLDGGIHAWSCQIDAAVPTY